MLENVAAKTIAPLLLRAALAAVFIFHGLEKVSPEAGYGFKWDKMPDPPAAPLQAAVAWGELLGGGACALGLFTRVAAAGLAAIMAGAIVTVTGPQGFSLGKQGFEYNFVLIMICVSLILTGAGTFSFDRILKVKWRGPANY